jgi:hypothetical protein
VGFLRRSVLASLISFFHFWQAHLDKCTHQPVPSCHQSHKRMCTLIHGRRCLPCQFRSISLICRKQALVHILTALSFWVWCFTSCRSWCRNSVKDLAKLSCILMIPLLAASAAQCAYNSQFKNLLADLIYPIPSYLALYTWGRGPKTRQVRAKRQGRS